MTMMVAVTVVCLCVSNQVWGAVAAEWTFEVDESLTTDSAASTASTLLGTTTVYTGATGISTKWASYLVNGSMTVPLGNNQGVIPIASATALFQHSNVEGTFYAVMSPNYDLGPKFVGVFGIAAEGRDPGYASSKVMYGPWFTWAGEYGDWDAGEINRSSDTVSNIVWDPAKWYFLAASWTPGGKNVMYLREMASGGPSASPAGLVGVDDGSLNPVGASIAADAPLLLGGWTSGLGLPPGTTGYGFNDGTGGDYAWAQFLNTAVTLEDMQAKFDTLGAGEPADCQQVWNWGYGMPIDLNRDCYVNWADFSVFASDWLRCNDPADPQCEETW